MRNIIFILLCTALTCFAQGDAPVITSISSTNLVKGEYAVLHLTYRDEAPEKKPPESMDTQDIAIRLRGSHRQSINGQRFYSYRYLVAPQKAGNFTIPSLVLPHKGITSQSLEIPLSVHSPDSLIHARAPYQGRDISFYSALFPQKTSLYPGEAISVEYKIFIPQSAQPQRWGLPKVEEMSNCTAWRFQSPSSSNDIGYAVLDGQQYAVASYSTVLSAIKPGQASFGPLETEVYISPSTSRPQWGFMRKTVELPVPYQATEFTIKPFPSTPPAEFQGAVGTFAIEAVLPTKTSISLNESITAAVTVSGSGNLPHIEAPLLEDSSTWKVIDISKAELGEERKSLTGSVTFNYILQPQRGADSFPRFTFSHFNPETAEFYIDTTETAAIEVSAPAITGNAMIAAADVPVAQMNDILAPLSNIHLGSAPTPNKFPIWLWQLIPASLFTYLLVLAFTKCSSRHAKKDKTSTSRQLAFKQLESCDDAHFLKHAGGFIETWLKNERSEELDRILVQRDNQCYQPDSALSTSEPQRKKVLATLQKHLLFLLCCALTFSQKAQAEDAFQQWLDGDYQEALESYQQQLEKHPYSADLEFNIGTTYTRLNQPGVAALHYQRALAIEPTHPEAMTNLAFIQKIQGSILPEPYSSVQQWSATFSPTLYQQLTFAGLWLIAISVLALKVSPWKSISTTFLVITLTLSFFLSTASGYLWFIHPERSLTTEGQAAMLTQFSPVLTEPITVSGKELEKKTRIKATPASPCRIIAQRANWSYILLANGVRGWVPSDTVSAIEK